MINRIKLYFKSKKLEAQIRYSLLTLIGQFMSEKELYIEFFQKLINIDFDNFSDELMNKIMEFTSIQGEGEKGEAKECFTPSDYESPKGQYMGEKADEHSSVTTDYENSVGENEI